MCDYVMNDRPRRTLDAAQTKTDADKMHGLQRQRTWPLLSHGVLTDLRQKFFANDCVRLIQRTHLEYLRYKQVNMLGGKTSTTEFIWKSTS